MHEVAYTVRISATTSTSFFVREWEVKRISTKFFDFRKKTLLRKYESDFLKAKFTGVYHTSTNIVV